MSMEIFDEINRILMQHPELLAQLAFFFRLKFWCLLILFGVFLYRARDREGDVSDNRRFVDDEFIA